MVGIKSITQRPETIVKTTVVKTTVDKTTVVKTTVVQMTVVQMTVVQTTVVYLKNQLGSLQFSNLLFTIERRPPTQ